jgi:hypothetical protein
MQWQMYTFRNTLYFQSLLFKEGHLQKQADLTVNSLYY